MTITLRLTFVEPSDGPSRVSVDDLAQHLAEELAGSEYWPDAAEEATAPYLLDEVEWTK